jgi:hypothetical protein
MKMKQPARSPAPIVIPAEIAARCDGADQFEKFDQLVSALVTVPKSAINKEEKKWKRARARKRATKSS